MCSVYYISDEFLRQIRQLAKEYDRRLSGLSWSKDIRPTDFAPVLTAGSGKGGLKLDRQKWGYPGVSGKGVVINARQESVWDKRLFQNGIQYHRSIIPADHFYEWNSRKEKFTFTRSDKRNMFLAGFCDMLDNEERFVIITTEANESMSPVHDRMPLILEEDQLEDWIYRDKAAQDLLHQKPVLLDRDTPYEQLSLF